ncbi:Protein FAR1-RELATED SEQUENCE 3 [Abeliophyllum distichum]|uniref:Protein FAR1-RELATED SEQUENCE 3 n=1 Tax=Abeliophyllum distichum TaxID=126358 RepID=A0ABD1PTI9_9LAMI
MEIDAGGPDSVAYVERDVRNHERNIREELKGHDAETLVEYFSFEKEKSPYFYIDYDTDSDNKLVRYLWADSESRISYAFFGDAVIFDTTYNTNKYSMIFAPFVGVNHHGQTVLFGCGLLSDESTKSFVWLLSKFMDAMPGQASQIIITDQNAAIAKVISMVLPSTFHRSLTRNRNKNTKEHNTIHDLSFVRAKGYRKRLKSSKEKSLAKNIRQCSACGQNGHDKRTCPKLVIRSTMETYQPNMNDQVFTQDEERSEATFMSYASSQ